MPFRQLAAALAILVVAPAAANAAFDAVPSLPASPPQIAIGGTSAVLIRVVNNGPDPSPQITVQGTYDSTLVSAGIAPGPNYSGAGYSNGSFSMTTAPLAPGAAAYVFLYLTGTASGVAHVAMHVTTANADTSNDTAALDLPVGLLSGTFDPFAGPVGLVGKEQPVTVTNLSGGSLTLGTAKAPGGDWLRTDDDTCSGTLLASAATCLVNLRFAPQTTGTRNGFLTLAASGGPGNFNVPLALTGTGTTGPVGPTGAAGVSGATGAAGQGGPTGSAGATGPAGAIGAAGQVGPAGPQGQSGPTGPAGQSVTGPAGQPGPKGDAGPIGPTGATGPAAKLAIAAASRRTRVRAGHALRVAYAATAPGKVTFVVLKGRRTVGRASGTARAGANHVTWKARGSLASGRYAYQLTELSSDQTAIAAGSVRVINRSLHN